MCDCLPLRERAVYKPMADECILRAVDDKGAKFEVQERHLVVHLFTGPRSLKDALESFKIMFVDPWTVIWE